MKTVKVEICQGTSCHLLGSQELVDAMESLPPKRRRQIDVCTLDCLKSCRQGPNVRIDGVVFSGMTQERLLTILDEKLCRTAS